MPKREDRTRQNIPSPVRTWEEERTPSQSGYGHRPSSSGSTHPQGHGQAQPGQPAGSEAPLAGSNRGDADEKIPGRGPRATPGLTPEAAPKNRRRG